MKKLFLALALAALAAPASALLMVSATVNGQNACATDNNVACLFGTQLPDTSATANILSLGSTSTPVTIGGVDVFGSIQVAIYGNPDVLDSSSLTVVNNNLVPVTVTVAVSATNFQQASVAATSGSGTFRPGDGNAITMEWWNDPVNGQGAETSTDRPGTLIDTFSATAPASTFLPFSFSHNGGPFVVSDPGLYSMTEWFTFTLGPGDSLISRGQTEIKEFAAVPEPGSLALMGLGLAGLGFVRRAGKKKEWFSIGDCRTERT
jgi:hypothetical protein